MTDQMHAPGTYHLRSLFVGLAAVFLLTIGIIVVARTADTAPDEDTRPTAQAVDACIEQTRDRIARLRASLDSGEWAERNTVSVSTAAEGFGTRVLGPLRVDLLDIEFLIRRAGVDTRRQAAALEGIRATRETFRKGHAANIEAVNSTHSDDAYLVMRLLDDVDNHLVKILAIIREPAPGRP